MAPSHDHDHAPRIVHALLALAVLVVGTACGSPVDQGSPVVGCPAALIRGTLELLGSDLGLMDSQQRHLVVDWPDGYVTRDIDGQPSLVDPAGRLVARAGDAVEITGGEIRVGEWYACGHPIVRPIAAP